MSPKNAEAKPAAFPLVDTHAHVHFDSYRSDVDKVLHGAREAGVTKIVTVGVNTADSRQAVSLASSRENVWATVGIHPHDADEAEQGMAYIAGLAVHPKVVAIGECGLDLARSKTTLEQQKSMRLQIELAEKLNRPVVFHVREAFDQFFRLIDEYSGIRGVVHSFTGDRRAMEKAVERDFYVALNGIITFTKDQSQLEAAKALPLSHLLLETDCPFLSPAPYRGKVNEPARIVDIAAFLADLRGESIEALANQTTKNAEELFNI